MAERRKQLPMPTQIKGPTIDLQGRNHDQSRCQTLSPWLGELVEYGLGLSYWHAHLCRLGGPVQQPYARVDNYISPSQWLRIWLQMLTRRKVKDPESADDKVMEGIDVDMVLLRIPDSYLNAL